MGLPRQFLPNHRRFVAEIERRRLQSQRDRALRHRPAQYVGQTGPRDERMITHKHVPFAHPHYNTVFAGGMQHGPVPKPAFTPGKPGFSYLPSRGSVSITLTVPPQTTTIVFASPQCGSPFMSVNVPASAYNTQLFFSPSTATPITRTEMATAFVDMTPAQSNIFFTAGVTVNFIPWVGGIDPRTMVSGNEGPEAYYRSGGSIIPDLKDTSDTTKFVLSQFMGGRVHIDTASAFNTLGQIAVFDTKSFPTLFGVKLPFTTAYTYDTNDSVVMSTGVVTSSGINSVVEPSRDDFVRLYPPDIWVSPAGGIGTPYTFEGAFQTARRLNVMGGSTSSSGHCRMNLPPDGQNWFGWTSIGPYAPVSGASGYINSASIGSAPAFNPLFYACLGQPCWFVRNDGSAGNGNMQVSLNAELFYNTQIPTNGSASVLNQTAVVATPHAPETALLHSTATLAHSPREAEESHLAESHASAASTQQLPSHPAVKVGAIAPSVSALVPAAAHHPAGTLHALESAVSNPLKTVTGLAKKALSDPVSALASLAPFL